MFSRLRLGIRAHRDDNLTVRTAQPRMRVGGTLTTRAMTAGPSILGVWEARDRARGTPVFHAHDDARLGDLGVSAMGLGAPIYAEAQPQAHR